MLRQIYIINATQVVVSESNPQGVYSNVTNYPKQFDSRNYGYSQLSKMLRAIPRFEVGGAGAHVWVKDKEAK